MLKLKAIKVCCIGENYISHILIHVSLKVLSFILIVTLFKIGLRKILFKIEGGHILVKN